MISSTAEVPFLNKLGIMGSGNITVELYDAPHSDEETRHIVREGMLSLAFVASHHDAED